MKTLAFDTSLRYLAVALLDDARVIGSVMEEGKRSRNEKLLPAVDSLLREAGLEIGDVERIVVTRGPGSFTGVRIGLATAQGLGFATGAELWPIGTHRAVAIDRAGVVVIGDAGRGDVFISEIDDRTDPVEPRIVRREQATEIAGNRPVIDVDEWASEHNLAIEAGLLAARLPRTEEPLVPLYVRVSAAEEKLLRGEL